MSNFRKLFWIFPLFIDLAAFWIKKATFEAITAYRNRLFRDIMKPVLPKKIITCIWSSTWCYMHEWSSLRFCTRNSYLFKIVYFIAIPVTIVFLLLQIHFLYHQKSYKPNKNHSRFHILWCRNLRSQTDLRRLIYFHNITGYCSKVLRSLFFSFGWIRL